MKKDTISVSLEAEKLEQSRNIWRRKEIDVQDELAEQLQKLYEKYVPVNVREYIDERMRKKVELKHQENKLKILVRLLLHLYHRNKTIFGAIFAPVCDCMDESGTSLSLTIDKTICGRIC